MWVWVLQCGLGVNVGLGAAGVVSGGCGLGVNVDVNSCVCGVCVMLYVGYG